jgi:hypothetical protein
VAAVPIVSQSKKKKKKKSGILASLRDAAMFETYVTLKKGMTHRAR